MHTEIAAVLAGEKRYHVAACRAEDLLDSLPDGCISLIAVDHPYHKVKSDEWDREHATADGFLQWTGQMLDRYRRVLAPNGSLYVFASPKMAWGVEGEVRKRFEVLSNIRWRKPGGRANGACKEALRAPFPDSETVVFAEQRGSDATAMGAVGYDAKCDELRGFVFEPLRAYLDGERERAGFTRQTIDSAWQTLRGNKGGMSSHWFSRSQWALPTRESYEWLRSLFNSTGAQFLQRDHEFMRREYEELRAQYEELRRPFTVSADVPYTDVWDYPTVQRYQGKHSCEKPWAMGLDIVRASSRPNDVVLDCFSGSGTFPAAAVALGRRTIACDMDTHWAEQAQQRCARAMESPALAERNAGRASNPPRSAPIFSRARLMTSVGQPQLNLF